VLPRLTRIVTQEPSGGLLRPPAGPAAPDSKRPPPRAISSSGKQVVRWGPRRVALYLAGVALAAALTSLLVFRHTAGGAASPAAPEGPADLDSLTRTLVETQVELSRKRLAAGDPDDAVRQAERALGFDPRSAAAREALEEARSVRDRIATAASDARASVDRGDTAGAAAAFWRLIQDAPDHSAATELAPGLEAFLKPQVGVARQAMDDSRRAAEKARADRTEEFTEGAAFARDGDAAQSRGAYATATCAFMKAAHRFRRARR
jgi:tetratricopeptide (TPR) repeat protein